MATTVVPPGPTRHKLSRFPSTLLVKTLLFASVIPRTDGHNRCMAKLIGDNRVILSLFLVLAFLNAGAIVGGYYG